MIATFTVGIMWQTLVVVNFYINRTEIAANHCINKTVPKSNCKGSCHLKKQLSSTQQPQTTDSVLPQIETGFIFLFGFNPTTAQHLHNSLALNKPPTPLYLCNKSAGVHSTIFHPPRFS